MLSRKDKHSIPGSNSYHSGLNTQEDQRECETFLSLQDELDLEHPCIQNIPLHHPSFNTTNNTYNQAFQAQCYTIDGQTDSMTVDIPTAMITLTIKNPLNQELTQIQAAADTGSDICALGHNCINFYKLHRKIRTDKRGLTISTGGGKVKIFQYVDIPVRFGENKFLAQRFWCLEHLTHDYLVSNTLIHKLGFKLVQTMEKYEHKPKVIDFVGEDEFDDQTCTLYPLSTDEPLDISSVQIDDENLKSFIHEQLHLYNQCIAKHEYDSGRIKQFEFPIDFISEPNKLKDGFQSKEYWCKPAHRQEILRQLDDMERHGLIEKNINTNYVSSIFCVPKKTGDVRIVFDYRKLNQITQKIYYEIPNINSIFDKFKGKNYITSLDLKGGYWHIPVRKSDRHKLGFRFNGETYRWKVLPFGPTNAPMFFQRVMQSVFEGLNFVSIYLDDVVILSESLDEHKRHLKVVFDRLRQFGLKLRLDKCIWGANTTEYLGYIVDKSGIQPKPDYIQKILDVAEPKTKKQLRKFIGLAQFIHKFIPQMQVDLQILTQLTKHNGQKNGAITLNATQKAAFHNLRRQIQDTSKLNHPDFTKPFHLFTDASKYGIGGMIAQYDQNGILHPISYGSKVFNEQQCNWHVSEQELYAVVYFIEHWQRLLRYQKFHVHTDHKNLQTLFNKQDGILSGKLWRWAVRLQEFHFECHYIKGEENIMADWLSRESVYLHSPQYKFVKQFLARKPKLAQKVKTNNYIRNVLSNYGGKDIYNLYMKHLATTITSPVPLHNKFFDQPYEWQYNHMKVMQSPDPQPCTLSMNYSLPHFERQPQVLILTRSRAKANSTSEAMKPRHRKLDVRPDAPKLPVRKHLRRSKFGTSKPDRKRLWEEMLKRKEYNTLRRTLQKEVALSVAKHQSANNHVIAQKPSEMAYNSSLLANMYSHNTPVNYVGQFTKHNVQSKDFFDLVEYQQEQDAICFILANHLHTGNKELLNDLPRHLKRFVLAGRFVLDKNDIVCWQIGSEHNLTRLMMLPATMRKSALTAAHDMTHHGRDRMIRIIKQQFHCWWPNMEREILAHCQACPACQHVKNNHQHHSKQIIPKLKLFAAKAPFQQISIDIVGPLPMTDDGERYIISILDRFSRYCMLQATKTVTAVDIVKCLDKWISIFGPPKSILSDNGPQFISAIWQDFNKVNHTKVQFTSTYHPQCNGMVERLHKWIKERLVLIAYDANLKFYDGEDSWTDYLPIIQYTYNSTPNKMTTYCPMDVIFGLNDHTLSQMSFNVNNTTEYIDYMSKRKALIHKQTLLRNKEYHKQFKQNATSNQFEVGQLVLYDLSTHYKGNRRKLGSHYVGPFEIIKIFNDGSNATLRSIAEFESNNNVMNQLQLHPVKITNVVDHPGVFQFTVHTTQIKLYRKPNDPSFAPSETAMRSVLTLKMDETTKKRALHHFATQYCPIPLRM